MNTLVVLNIENEANRETSLSKLLSNILNLKNVEAISAETSRNRSRLQTTDIKVKIFHSINGDRGMPRRFSAEISHRSRARSRRANAIRPSGIPFPARRGGCVADIGPIANIEKRQSPVLSSVMNARKILLAPTRLSLPPAVRNGMQFLRRYFSATFIKRLRQVETPLIEFAKFNVLINSLTQRYDFTCVIGRPLVLTYSRISIAKLFFVQRSEACIVMEIETLFLRGNCFCHSTILQQVIKEYYMIIFVKRIINFLF